MRVGTRVILSIQCGGKCGGFHEPLGTVESVRDFSASIRLDREMPCGWPTTLVTVLRPFRPAANVLQLRRADAVTLLGGLLDS